MLVIDTHAHLNDSAFDKNREEIIEKSLKNGVWMINVGYDARTSALAARLSEKCPEGVFAAVALHPNNIEEGFSSEVYREFFKNQKVVAVGEAGLDYARIMNNELGIKEQQKEIFIKHIELALEFNKPLIIHCNKAHDDVLSILNSCFLISAKGGSASGGHNSRLRGVAHSFLGNYKQARRYRELGFKLGFNGIITYARDYDKVILDTPLEDILIETDCPYLAPVPYRGERNEPIYVIEVAKKLAEIKSIPLEKIAEQTAKNAKELFNI